MNGPDQVRHRRFFLLLAPLLLAPLLLASVAIPAAPSDAAEGGDTSAAQVAEGLKTIQNIATDVAFAAGKDKAKAATVDEGIEPVWKKIEDTVRGNDKDSYIAFEDAFETLATAAKAGDAKKAGAAADAVAAAVKAYVAKYPAARAAAAAAPAPTATTPAAEAGDATLARTGPHASALAALAGAAFALGGLAVIAGARRRRLSPIA